MLRPWVVHISPLGRMSAAVDTVRGAVAAAFDPSNVLLWITLCPLSCCLLPPAGRLAHIAALK